MTYTAQMTKHTFDEINHIFDEINHIFDEINHTNETFESIYFYRPINKNGNRWLCQTHLV